jgi:hypothetical protein
VGVRVCRCVYVSVSVLNVCKHVCVCVRVCMRVFKPDVLPAMCLP